MQRSPLASEGTEHVFVNGVRFWSMFAVIAVHTLQASMALTLRRSELYCLVVTPVKFGTVAFFLISGFLLGNRLDACRPLKYLGRRMKVVFVPWLCWFAAMVAYSMADHGVALAWSAAGLRGIAVQTYHVLFFTPYWFVPNMMLGLSLLLLFRRYVFDLRLGAAFLAIDLFYTVNIYGRWIPAGHTEALLGFVFFLWLGSYAAWRFDELSAWLETMSMTWMIGLTLAAALTAYAEARLLMGLHSIDPVNTLRLSNQVFAVLVVLTLMKVRRATWPGFLNARRVTFGLYLSHPFALEVGQRLAHFATHGFARRLMSNPAGFLPVWAMVFVVVYVLGLAATQLIAAWPASEWLVGASSSRRPAVAPVHAVAPSAGGVVGWRPSALGTNV